MGNKISREEVENLEKQGKVILFINNKVYDVTNFNHPPGNDIIQKYKMTDAKYHYDFHSPHAKRIWNSYFIGYLKK